MQHFEIVLTDNIFLLDQEIDFTAKVCKIYAHPFSYFEKIIWVATNFRNANSRVYDDWISINVTAFHSLVTLEKYYGFLPHKIVVEFKDIPVFYDGHFTSRSSRLLDHEQEVAVKLYLKLVNEM